MEQQPATPKGGHESSPSPGARGTTGNLETVVYEHLCAIARRQMQQERPGHTLTATALVHEAYLKLAPAGLIGADATGFYHAAAAAMRRILIDHARRRGAAKRGGRDRYRAEEIQNILDLAREDRLPDALALDEAILRLEKEEPQAAGVVRLRFYAGLGGDEAARVLGISPRQADREWAYARAFLLKELRTEDDRTRSGGAGT